MAKGKEFVNEIEKNAFEVDIWPRKIHVHIGRAKSLFVEDGFRKSATNYGQSGELAFPTFL